MNADTLEAMQAYVEAAAGPSAALDLSFRPMFGGVMVYSSGKPFASLSATAVSVKVAGADRDELLLEPGARPLQHPGEQPSKQYVTLPEHIVSDEERLRVWLERSAANAPRSARKKRKPPKG